MGEGLARVVTIGSILLTAVSLALAYRFAGRRRRVRTGYDIARAVIGMIAIVMMAAVAHTATPPVAIVAAITVGLGLGYAQGSNLEISRDGGGAFARRTPVALALWGAGIIVVQVAGLTSRAGGVQFGQAIAWFGAAMGIGLLAGRNRPLQQARRSPAGSGAALLLGVLLAPSVVLWMPPTPSAQAQSDGLWVLVETRVNPHNEATDFVVGVTPNYYESPRFDGSFERYTVGPSTLAWSSRWVEREVEDYNVTISFSITPPPPVLVPFEEVRLQASGSGSGSVTRGNPIAQFEFWTDPARLEGETRLVIGVTGDVPSSGAVAPTFEVPPAWFENETLTIQAGMWNCAACLVQWVYRAEPDTTDTTEAAAPPATTAPTTTSASAGTPSTTAPTDSPTTTVSATGSIGAEDDPPDDDPPSSDPSVGVAPPTGGTTSDDGEITPEEAAGQAIAGVIAAAAIGAITWAEASEEIARILGGGAPDPGDPLQVDPDDPCGFQQVRYEAALAEWQRLQSEVDALRSEHTALQQQISAERAGDFAGAVYDLGALGVDIYTNRVPTPGAFRAMVDAAKQSFGRSIVKQLVQAAASGQQADIETIIDKAVVDAVGLPAAQDGNPASGGFGALFSHQITSLFASMKSYDYLKFMSTLADPGTLSDPAVLKTIEQSSYESFFERVGPWVGVVSKYVDFWHKNKAWGEGVERRNKMRDELTRIGTEIGEIEYDLGYAKDARDSLERMLTRCREEMG